MTIFESLSKQRVIPVIKIDRLSDTQPLMECLSANGMSVVEITLRSDIAYDALIAASLNSSIIVGVGTVINAAQAERAIKCGAKFIVAPGFSSQVARVCREHGTPYIPGVMTPTEIITAVDCGLHYLKFFPAESAGGVRTINAISAAFPQLKFMVTGGIGMDNMNSYLSSKACSCVGASFIVDSKLISCGDYAEIGRRAKHAMERARTLED